MTHPHPPPDPAAPGVLIVPGQFPQASGDLGGIFVWDYARAVVPHHPVTILGTHVHGARAIDVRQEQGVTVYRGGGSGGGARGWGKAVAYPRWLHRSGQLGRTLDDVAVVHAHDPTFAGLLALRIARSHGARVVLSIHTGPFSKLLRNPVLRRLTRWTMEQADVVLTVSEDLRRQVQAAGIRPRRMEVSYNPVDTDLFVLPPDAAARRPEIVFVSRMEPYKGARRVFEAFRRLHERYPDWTLTLIGGGPEQALIEQQLREAPVLAGKVSLPGRLTKAEIAARFQQAAFFAFPSEHETFGLVIAEAMSAGLPVVVGNETAPPEFVDATCGLLVPPRDVEALTEALEEMMNAHDRYDRGRLRGQVEQRFGLRAMGSYLSTLYRELVP